MINPRLQLVTFGSAVIWLETIISPEIINKKTLLDDKQLHIETRNDAQLIIKFKDIQQLVVTNLNTQISKLILQMFPTLIYYITNKFDATHDNKTSVTQDSSQLRADKDNLDDST